MIRGLDHVNLRTADLDRAVEWYRRVLGLTRGPRPDFHFGGAWLYAGDQPIIHLVEVASTEGYNAGPVTLEHFALKASGYKAFRERLTTDGIAFEKGELNSKAAQVIQVNIHDPDGNHIHVDFPLSEGAP